MVFHYVASQLKGVPLFENDFAEKNQTGAVYNDFDCDPISFLATEEESLFTFPQATMSEVP